MDFSAGIARESRTLVVFRRCSPALARGELVEALESGFLPIAIRISTATHRFWTREESLPTDAALLRLAETESMS
jgi:hypothetical protein